MHNFLERFGQIDKKRMILKKQVLQQKERRCGEARSSTSSWKMFEQMDKTNNTKTKGCKESCGEP